MADIQLRFHKDMLVLSGSLESQLRAQGFDVEQAALFPVLEEEALTEALRLQAASGAQCLVTPTRDITRARLAHVRAQERDAQIAQAARDLVAEFTPQHILCQIGPTGLPIDPSSKTSLVANRDQYARAVCAFDPACTEAFFLNGMVSLSDLRCALMGVRAKCSTPVIVSVDASPQGSFGTHGESLLEAAQLAQEFEADVFGFAAQALPEELCDMVRKLAQAVSLPILVQIDIPPRPSNPRLAKLDPQPYDSPDGMPAVAAALRAAGAQFLRAIGQATPAYTGALAAACAHLDCIR